MIVEINDLTEKLFAQKWSCLDGEILSSKTELKKPGVYLLAYPEATLEVNLNDQNVRPEDVCYVGMSNSKGGLAARLRKFMQAIEIGKGHTAGNRFFKNNHCIPYSKLDPKSSFYFVGWPIDCCTTKLKAAPDDFRKMGHVACLEQYAIAHVSDRTGHVPKLNISAGGTGWLLGIAGAAASALVRN